MHHGTATMDIGLEHMVGEVIRSEGLSCKGKQMAYNHALPGSIKSRRAIYPALVVGQPRGFWPLMGRAVVPGVFIGLLASPIAVLATWWAQPKDSRLPLSLAIQTLISMALGMGARIGMESWRVGLNQSFSGSSIPPDLRVFNWPETVMGGLYAGILTLWWGLLMRWLAKKIAGKHFMNLKKAGYKLPPYKDLIPKALEVKEKK